MKYYMSILFFCLCAIIYAQEPKFSSLEVSVNELIDGTLLVPKDNDKPKLAIIIAGSGPTDRNGNQNFSNNNSLKKLAESLSNRGIATYRYDKRIVKQILKKKIDPNITFDDFVTDAISVIDYFKKEGKYSNIYIIGHSQGSLVGMLAAKGKANGFISLAGAGQSIDDVITEQIAAMDPSLVEGTKKAFDSLKEGKLTTEYPQALGSIFRADVQPFIMNWMQYKPQEIIKTLDIPILIINGTKDLQVSVDEAKLLKQGSDKAEIEIIDNMNHVLFIIAGDKLENSKSYNESFRKISEDLITKVSDFIIKK
ncbi:alpha/beta hydrolase [Psychroserpens luteolus]|uniref:alpha/beta hydrolase n=1 Tax=Psychroserpens luteolus TaxID=2855840 RepID=UPI001E5E67CD|nr:alpha/beta hydrolase [Psychroserpens luteolus]MCD2261016.1 lysophospholipase [Psychroserpens luteolus]